jgi:signal transduction histidine kinase
MGSDRDVPASDDPATVPVDAFPEPILGYEHREGTPAIVRQNDAFERTFGVVSTGTPVREWLLTETEADDETVDAVCSALADEEPVDEAVVVQRTGDGTAVAREYRLRTLDRPGDGSDGAEGHLLATTASSTQPPEVEVDRIASVISHDLRNPLDVANAHLRAARETGDEEHFDQVRQSHDRMERIVQDVLTLARGEHVLNVAADVDVGAVARDAWATVETESASLAVGDDLPETDADPNRLQRLFENLFRNAVEHAQSPEDTATTGVADRNGATATHGVTVRVGRTEDGFFVADNGVGISPGERERVFDPGYSANERNNGTGLGLTIVERIAEAHDWTVSLGTGSSGGARFEFLPSSDDH